MKRILLAAVLIVLPIAAHAQAADWNVKANAGWVGRADVNVHVTLRDTTITGAPLVSPTEMLGPFTATELRGFIIPTTLGGSGKTVCATAYAYVGSDPNVPVNSTGSNRSVEVSAASPATCKSTGALGAPTVSGGP